MSSRWVCYIALTFLSHVNAEPCSGCLFKVFSRSARRTVTHPEESVGMLRELKQLCGLTSDLIPFGFVCASVVDAASVTPSWRK